MQTNVLLTGAGGNLAHFIYNALGYSKLRIRIVACDCTSNAVGLFQASAAYVIPKAGDPDYLSSMINICKSEKIDVIMAGGMAEMRLLAREKDLIKGHSGAFVAASPAEVIERLEDKWELTRYLTTTGCDAPVSVLPSDVQEFRRFVSKVPYPYVVKDRFGSGSQGLGFAQDRRQLDELVETISNPIVQEYLSPDDEEYTVGVFLNSSSEPVGSIVMKRELLLGMTFKASVLPGSTLGPYCEKLLEDSGGVGPINVQLRLTNRGPVVFEINPRFSSTTSARAYYGFNEPEMCIRHFLFNEVIERPSVRKGRFFRVIEDVFVDDEEFRRMNSEGRV